MFYHDEFKRIKKEAMIASEELGYPEEVTKNIEKAKTEREITRILKNYRLSENEEE